jgi:DNA-binding NarL/FixJ family response regulator
MTRAAASGNQLSILVADSPSLFRAGLQRLLEDLPCEVAVREAKDGIEAIETLKRDRFELIMLEHMMPDMLPVPLLHSVRRYAHGTPFIVLSAADDSEQAWMALEAGASGFVPKNCKAGVMLQAVLHVLSGEVYIPATVLAHPRSRPSNGSFGGEQPDPGCLPTQQRIILQYLASGYSNKEIALALDIGEGTVKSRVAALLRGLGAKNRTHAIIIAGQRGLLPPQVRSDTHR